MGEGTVVADVYDRESGGGGVLGLGEEEGGEAFAGDAGKCCYRFHSFWWGGEGGGSEGGIVCSGD